MSTLFENLCGIANSHAELARAQDSIIVLSNAVQEALEFAEGQTDVCDGPDGEPQANKAMLLAQTLHAALAKVPNSLSRAQHTSQPDEHQLFVLRLLDSSGRGATERANVLVSRAIPGLLAAKLIDYNESRYWGYALTETGRAALATGSAPQQAEQGGKP